MPRRFACRAAGIALQACLASSLYAFNLTGTWIGTIPKEGRSAAKDVAIQFVQNGLSLSGKVYNDYGLSDKILRGSVSDGKVEFDVEAMEQRGNEIHIVLFEFRGTIDGARIELTRERTAARDATSGETIPVRRPWDSDEEDRKRRFRSLRLERLFH